MSLTASQLAKLSQLLGTPIYWAGPEKGYRYGFSSVYGNTYVRYLPRGVEATATNPKLRIVASYPVPGGFSRLRAVARGHALAGPGGSIYLQGWHGGFAPNGLNVLVAFPGVASQTEVYDPHPGVAAKLVSSGRIRPVSP